MLAIVNIMSTFVKVQLVNRIQHLANAWPEFVNLVYFIGPQVPMFNPCQTSVEFYLKIIFKTSIRT